MATVLAKPEQRFPKITEEGLDDLRKRIGVKIENTVEPWNYEASRDAIHAFQMQVRDFPADGVGRTDLLARLRAAG